MQHVVSPTSHVSARGAGRLSAFANQLRSAAPSLIECGLATISAALLILSFPDIDAWPLAWLAIIPLLLVIVRRPQPWPMFFAGWLFGSIFFYGSCYWLTYSMIHFGGMPTLIAFLMLIPGALLVGLFPALFGAVLARLINRWDTRALLLAPFIWVALEWARLEITGQLWNAIGYSQAYQPLTLGAARWGGVYAVGFLILAVNSAIAFALFKRNLKGTVVALGLVLLVALFIFALGRPRVLDGTVAGQHDAVVVAVQPNVPMDLVKSVDDMRRLTDQHFTVSETALQTLPADGKPRLIIWPESPMYFTYGSDQQLRDRIAAFAKAHKVSLLLNSQEVAPNDGLYNSALLINEQGSLVAQYDKIRLLPFGEYVPLPKWFPGAGLITALVGGFTPGAHYRQMQVGNVRTGVFICIESAYPAIARQYTRDGADVLINISNDGYLGPTAVMRQHLANAVFRAVENGRPVVRVTNTGITAYITPDAEIRDATGGFQPDIRVWGVTRATDIPTFYARHGDVFVAVCATISLLLLLFSFTGRRAAQRIRK
ncbi:MAG: apolipoprotein N-acyltransferase [Acidobacteriota bacterium]|nr:apolipoprotein N-acyltransferase [Acidobacteriota bacterium]